MIVAERVSLALMESSFQNFSIIYTFDLGVYMKN